MRLLLLSICLLWQTKTFAQHIPFVTPQDLERYLHPENDTVYVLNFWATWCKPCVDELPAFEKLQTKYASKKVKILLISTDFRKDVESRLSAFIQKNNLHCQVLFLNDPNPNSWINRISTAWTGAIPATLITRKGRPAHFTEGKMTYSKLNKQVKKRL